MKLLKAKKRVTCKDEPLVGVTPRVVEVPLENLMLTADNDWICLLYTSPSQRDKRQYHMTTSE